MSSPVVSIVIPAFNVNKFILFTLNSIAAQSLKKFECIIVDDFSTDNTRDICLKFLKTDKRFRMTSHRANAGLSAARNTGLRAAKGKYICFLDSDDLVMTDSLEMRVHTLEQSNDLKVIGTYCGSIGINETCEFPPQSTPASLKPIDFITAGGNCPFNANQPMFIRSLFINLGGFDHSLKQAEDYDMWMRILRYGYKILPTNSNGVTYRATPGSMIKRDPLLHLDTSYQRLMSCYDEPTLEQIPPRSPTSIEFLDKGLNSYLSQLNIANRVLEFIGIAIGVDQRFALAKKLFTYLPDYFKLIESHRPFINGVLKGVTRGLGYNVSNNKEELDYYLLIINELKKEFKNHFTLDSNFSAELQQNNLERNKALLNIKSDEIISQLGAQSLVDVVFIPHKDYHVATINLLKTKFEQLGLNFIIVDISMHYRDEGAKKKAQETGLPMIGYSNFLLGQFNPKLIVSFNDWDPIVRSIIVSAQASGINTAAIVEGIQDYDDADTKQARWAYKTADNIFLPGEFDAKYFKSTGQGIYSVGIPRVHALRGEAKVKLKWDRPKALINSNFSYGVLEEHRDQWVTDAVEACLEAGFEPVISRHPADKGEVYMVYQTSAGFYDAIRECSVHISKFASGIIEALAIGCPVIYYNAHNEQVDKFKSPLGAYSITNSKGELISELIRLPNFASKYLENTDKFLDKHAGYKDENSSEKLVMHIQNIVENQNVGMSNNFPKFKELMLEIDKETGSFNNLKLLREKFCATYGRDINRSCINPPVDKIERNQGGSIKDVHKLIERNEYDNAITKLLSLIESRPEFTMYYPLLLSLTLKTKLLRITLNQVTMNKIRNILSV